LEFPNSRATGPSLSLGNLSKKDATVLGAILFTLSHIGQNGLPQATVASLTTRCAYLTTTQPPGRGGGNQPPRKCLCSARLCYQVADWLQWSLSRWWRKSDSVWRKSAIGILSVVHFPIAFVDSSAILFLEQEIDFGCRVSKRVIERFRSRPRDRMF